jgi:hypothetical protein
LSLIFGDDDIGKTVSPPSCKWEEFYRS